jgi:hypothetical protein
MAAIASTPIMTGMMMAMIGTGTGFDVGAGKKRTRRSPDPTLTVPLLEIRTAYTLREESVVVTSDPLPQVLSLQEMDDSV